MCVCVRVCVGVCALACVCVCACVYVRADIYNSFHDDLFHINTRSSSIIINACVTLVQLPCKESSGALLSYYPEYLSGQAMSSVESKVS